MQIPLSWPVKVGAPTVLRLPRLGKTRPIPSRNRGWLELPTDKNGDPPAGSGGTAYCSWARHLQVVSKFGPEEVRAFFTMPSVSKS